MITVVVLTKNEEKNIVDCLESLSFCDEILLVDDNSQDRTVEIAKRMNATVLKHSLDNDFSRQRNFGLKMAKNDWVLFVDADERVNPFLAKEIIYMIAQEDFDGFYIKREDTMWGKKLKFGEAGNIWLLRLAKKRAGRWEGIVHEQWIITGRVGRLKNSLDHFPHQSIEQFLKEINYYTTLRAKELFKEGQGIHWHSIIIYPKLKFLVNYFIRLGFLDGLPGFIYAIMMSFHSFLVRGKLWILNQKK